MTVVDILSLPPGFGFHPTDAELVDHYLKGKIVGKNQEGDEVIPEINLYKYEPWDLPAKSCIPSRDSKWHFFSARDRKYPNSSRTNRATEAGYWKATGKDRNVYLAKPKRIVGTKKTLVFHEGRAPQGKRTDWVMHEYHLYEKECEAVSPGMHDSYVLCRISKKNGLDSEREDVHSIETKPSNDSTLVIAGVPQCELQVEEGSVGGIGKVESVTSPGCVDDFSEDSIEEFLNSLLVDPEPQMAFNMETDKSEVQVVLNSAKMECLIATTNSNGDLAVNSAYHEADSIFVDHAGLWLADLDSPVLQNLIPAPTFNHELDDNLTYQESGSSVTSYLENPARLDSENYPETKPISEAMLLQEMYMDLTGAPWKYPTQMRSSVADGVSFSDIGYDDEQVAVSPTTSNDILGDEGTGIQIRGRNLELPKTFAGQKIRLQIHKMETGATGEVKTCTYKAPSVAVLSEHDDSNHDAQERLDTKSPFKSKDFLASESSASLSMESQASRWEPRAVGARPTSVMLPRNRGNPKSEILLSGTGSGLMTTECGTKSVSKEVCHNGKLQPKECSRDAVSSKSTCPASVSGPVPRRVPFTSSMKNECFSGGSVDSEQPRGGVGGFMSHLRRYLSTGLNWLLALVCVLGTFLVLSHFLLRNICRYVKGISTLKL